MSKKQYDCDYFITKFEPIPDDKWCTGVYSMGDKRCAYGHLGLRPDHKCTNPNVIDAVNSIFMRIESNVGACNDGFHGWDKVSDTPKGRVLAALNGIKAGVDPRKATLCL